MKRGKECKRKWTRHPFLFLSPIRPFFLYSFGLLFRTWSHFRWDLWKRTKRRERRAGYIEKKKKKNTEGLVKGTHPTSSCDEDTWKFPRKISFAVVVWKCEISPSKTMRPIGSEQMRYQKHWANRAQVKWRVNIVVFLKKNKRFYYYDGCWFLLPQ